MKLAVLNLTGGGASVGYRRYVSAVLPRLAAFDEVEKVLCASPAALGVEGWLEPSPKINFARCEPFRFLRHSPDPGLKAALDAFGPDLIFVPLERYIDYKGLPVVTVLHNMAPLAGVPTGGGLKELLKAAAQKHETKLAVSRAAAVMAPSDFVRDFLIAKAGAAAGKVHTAHFGPSPVTASPSRPKGLGDATGKFIFTAGSMERYRGLEDLIEAMPALKAAVPGIILAVAGSARPATRYYLEELKELALKRGAGGDVFWLGSLPDEEMAWCYASCSAFVMTSRMESFGFPALEAMQHGCQCVSAASPCLPEMFGEAAVYYPPGDHAALSARVAEVLSRDASAKGMASAMALERAGIFSWDGAASRTLDVLRKAASGA